MKASSTTDEQNEDREVIFFTSGIIKPGDKVVYEITCLALKPGSTRALFCAHPSSYFGRPICDLCQTIIIKSE